MVANDNKMEKIDQLVAKYIDYTERDRELVHFLIAEVIERWSEKLDEELGVDWPVERMDIVFFENEKSLVGAIVSIVEMINSIGLREEPFKKLKERIRENK